MQKKRKEQFIVFAILSSAGEIEFLFTINRDAPYLSTGHSGDRYRIRYTSHSSLSTCPPDVNYLPTIPDTTTTNQTFLFPTRESPFIFPYTRVYILWTGGLHFSIPGNDENSAGGRIVRYPTLRVYTRHEGIDIRPRVLYRNVNALVKHEYSSGGERIVSTKYRGLFRVPTRVEVYKWTRVRISSETTPRRLGGNGGAIYSRYNLLLAAFSRERNETYVARANFSFVFRIEEYVGMRILILKIPPAIDT